MLTVETSAMRRLLRLVRAFSILSTNNQTYRTMILSEVRMVSCQFHIQECSCWVVKARLLAMFDKWRAMLFVIKKLISSISSRIWTVIKKPISFISSRIVIFINETNFWWVIWSRLLIIFIQRRAVILVGELVNLLSRFHWSLVSRTNLLNSCQILSCLSESCGLILGKGSCLWLKFFFCCCLRGRWCWISPWRFLTLGFSIHFPPSVQPGVEPRVEFDCSWCSLSLSMMLFDSCPLCPVPCQDIIMYNGRQVRDANMLSWFAVGRFSGSIRIRMSTWV